MPYLMPAGDPDLSHVLSGTSQAASLNLASILFQGGGQQIITSLDQSGLASGLTLLDFQPGTGVGIGTGAGGALKATITSMIRDASTGGTKRFTPITTGSHSCDRLLNLGGGNWQLVSGSSAPVLKLEQAAAGTRIDIDDSTRANVIAMLAGAIDQQYNSTQNVTWRISGGSFTTGRGWTGTGLPTTTGGAAVIGGGQVIVGRPDNNITSIATGGDLIMCGGVFKWRGGNIGNLIMLGGMVDFRDVPAAMTISAVIGTADVIDRSYLKSRGATNLVTISATQKLGGSTDTILQ